MSTFARQDAYHTYKKQLPNIKQRQQCDFATPDTIFALSRPSAPCTPERPESPGEQPRYSPLTCTHVQPGGIERVENVDINSRQNDGLSPRRARLRSCQSAEDGELLRGHIQGTRAAAHAHPSGLTPSYMPPPYTTSCPHTNTPHT